MDQSSGVDTDRILRFFSDPVLESIICENPDPIRVQFLILPSKGVHMVVS